MNAIVPNARVTTHMVCRSPKRGSWRQLTGASTAEMKPRVGFLTL